MFKNVQQPSVVTYKVNKMKEKKKFPQIFLVKRKLWGEKVSGIGSHIV